MTDVIRKPERRIDYIQAILKGKDEIKGISKFGNSRISTLYNDHIISVEGDIPGMIIYLVIDGNGKLKYSGRYFDREPGSKPLSPAELEAVKEPIFDEDRMIDEIILSFQESLKINPYEKEIAMQEEAEKITKAVRNQVVDIATLDPNYCKVKSAELQTKKPTFAPSIVNSFAVQDWKIVIEEVRQKIQQEQIV